MLTVLDQPQQPITQRLPICLTPESLAEIPLPPLTEPIVILSHGLGQDSSALLALYANDPAFRAKYVKGNNLFVLNADTSDEHDDSEQYAAEVDKQCRTLGIEFVRLGSAWSSNAWKDGHIGQFRRTKTIGLRTMRSCTDNLKITPIYRFLDQYLGRRLGVESGRKKALREYVRRFGKIRVMIGFAKGEERRVMRAATTPQLAFDLKVKGAKHGSTWMAECVERVYPLIDLGMDREACQRYVASVGLPVPMRSNCVRCHHSRHEDVLRISMVYPEKFAEWCELEQAKLTAWDGRVIKNDAVFGAKRLQQVADDAREALIVEHGPMTDAKMIEHLTALRFSRGHCVASSM